MGGACLCGRAFLMSAGSEDTMLLVGQVSPLRRCSVPAGQLPGPCETALLCSLLWLTQQCSHNGSFNGLSSALSCWLGVLLLPRRAAAAAAAALPYNTGI